MTPDSIPPAVAERLREEGRKQERERVLAALETVAVHLLVMDELRIARDRGDGVGETARDALAAVRRAIEEAEG